MGLEDSGGREIVQVKGEKKNVLKDFIERIFLQVQYKAWRDRSAPSDPGALLQLIDIVRALAARYVL